MNGTDYSDPNEVEIQEQDSGLFLSVTGDSVFLLRRIVSFYEHQSTFNPNMPLRQLLQTAKLYHEYVHAGNRRIYGTQLIKLPTPRFAVFYNGLTDIPEEMDMKLSDAYEVQDGMPQLELFCRVYNIGKNKNMEMKKKCPGINGYMIYVDKVRYYTHIYDDLEKALTRAVDECIDEGILADFFRKYREAIIGLDGKDFKYEMMLEEKDEIYQSMLDEKDEIYQSMLEEKDEIYQSIMKDKDEKFQSMMDEKDEKFQSMMDEKDEIYGAMIKEKDEEIAKLKSMLGM